MMLPVVAVRSVLKMGDPRLLQVSEAVDPIDSLALAPLWMSQTNTWWLGRYNPTRFAFSVGDAYNHAPPGIHIVYAGIIIMVFRNPQKVRFNLLENDRALNF